MDRLMDKIEEVQDLLSYNSWRAEHFASSKGLGRAGLTAFLLGLALGLSLATLGLLLGLQLLQGPWTTWLFHVLAVWSLYWLCLSLFHFLEFFSTALFQPAHLTADSYLVNHSTAYTAAALASWTEFWLEAFLLRGYKINWLVSLIGLALVVVGQVLRSVAMAQCGESFSHQIALRHLANHRLVTHGLYRFVRHPSYAGWFFWCIGMQVLLCNPVCTLAFVVISWRFFNERIIYEEATLLEFFGDSYRQYSQHTVSGIPFVRSRLL